MTESAANDPEDNLAFESWRYSRVVRVVRLPSGALGVLDARSNPLGIVQSLSDAEALTALTSLAAAFRRGKTKPAKFSAPVTRELDGIKITL